jgi:hypothetical protein
MKRFSILATEYPSDGHEVEICEVELNPEQIVAALERERTPDSRTLKWARVRVRDNEAAQLATSCRGILDQEMLDV